MYYRTRVLRVKKGRDRGEMGWALEDWGRIGGISARPL